MKIINYKYLNESENYVIYNPKKWIILNEIIIIQETHKFTPFIY
mgnify:CR=1 FL=1